MRRTALAVVATSAATAAVFAVPASAHLVRAEPLGAVTTIATAASGTAELVLYDDATLSPSSTHNPDVSISGDGRVIAFELTRADGTDDELFGMRLPAFAGGGTIVGGSATPQPTCTSWPSETVPLQSQCQPYRPKAILLHEGYYHLVVVTDGKPVRITLRLHGQHRGHAQVHMQQQIRTAEANLVEHESMGASTVTYGGSGGFQNATQVLTLAEARLHPSATLRAATGCARDDSGTPPPYAYSPACPGGSITSFGYFVNTPVEQLEGFGGGTAFLYTSDAMPTAVGGSFVDSDGPTYLGGVGLWIAGGSLQGPMAFSSGV